MTANSTTAAPDVAGTVFEESGLEVARSYAEALIGAAGKDGSADEVVEELESFLDAVGQEPALGRFLASPSIKEADKDRVLTRALDGRARPTAVRFLRVLNRHGRLPLLPPVVRQARAILDRRHNRRPVTVRSAVPLTDAEQAELRDRLQRMIQATPVLSLVVDPSLIGGLVVQVGDDVYDASVRSRLEQLRRRLIEGKTHEIQSRRNQFRDPE